MATQKKKAKNSLARLCCPNAHPNVIKFFDNIFQESTIQGLKYIGATKIQAIERIFWTIAFFSCLAFSIYLVQNVFAKYQASPVIISFQPEDTSVSQIPFPAITICNVNILKRSELTKLFDDLMASNKEQDMNATAEGVFLIEHLTQYCFAAQSFRRMIGLPLFDADGREDFLQFVQATLQGFNSTQTERYEAYAEVAWYKARRLYYKAAPSCRDMILKCVWAGNDIPCNETFFPLETRNGHCCVFNMMPKFILQNISSDDHRAQWEEGIHPRIAIDEWRNFSQGDMITVEEQFRNFTHPRHQTAGGKPQGLTILIHPELDEYSTCTTNDAEGFTMVAHSPVSLPNIMDYGVAIPPRSEAFVDVVAEVTTAKMKDLKDIDIEKRGCIFYTDKEAKLEHYNFYANENCFSECTAKYSYEICSCVLHYMPHNTTQKYCGAKDRKCVDDVLANVTMGMDDKKYCKKCKPACTEFDYFLHVSHFDLRSEVAANNFLYTSRDGTEKNATDYSIIHVFFGADTIYVKERKALYNAADLVANAGGLLSLALGVSIVSVIELVYFFTLRAYYHFHSEENKESGKVSRHTTTGNRNEVDIFHQDDYYSWAMKHYRIHVDVNSYATSTRGKPSEGPLPMTHS